MDKAKIRFLRMQRQFFTIKANEQDYLELYRDMQPGQNVYWNGFGQPPTLTPRPDFDDLEFNRRQQLDRQLIKGRFAGGNLGWIVPEDLELFAALYRKPLDAPNEIQLRLLERIEREGPLNIQQIKQDTGLLVKAITPALHRLQEAFLIYEDQYDGEWDRGWYRFAEMFPDTDLNRYSRQDALKIVLRRFAFRHVVFDAGMAKAFYRLPEKEIRAAIAALAEDGILLPADGGYMLADDREILDACRPEPLHFVCAIHRNDFLYKSNEPALKAWAAVLTEGLPYDHEPLQYLLIDGEFRAACVGHFRNGPYDLNDIVCDLPDAEARRDEILQAVAAVNFGKTPLRFMGKTV